jgi:uncharacterized protein
MGDTRKPFFNRKAMMSTQAKAKTPQKKKSNPAASIVWFEIPADKVERARKFYGELFGWKIEKFPGVQDYWHVDTGGGEDTLNGGLLTRNQPEQQITNYIGVKSVTKSMEKVEKLGGKVCTPKTAVPQMGYFAICQDTESNTFALWERNDAAK